MSHDAQVNTCYNVNCQRRTRTHDAAPQRRKPSMGSSSSCRAHHKAPFRRQQIGKHLHLAVLEYFFTNFTRSFFQSFLLILRIPCPARIEPPPKLSHNVVQCRAKSRDAQGNMCYNVDCQRRAKEHTLPGATRTQKVVTECHQKSRDRRVNTCYNANW